MESALFVYGTLKRGLANHDRFCRGLVVASPASVWGRLYDLPAGYPTLVIPPASALAWGTADPAFDASLTVASGEAVAPSASDEPPLGEWDAIEGELLVFDDLATRFAALDALEDFRPRGLGLYDRAVVRTLGPDSRRAWVYVAPHGRLPPAARRVGSRWP